MAAGARYFHGSVSRGRFSAPRGRIVWALAASVLLHVWLAERFPTGVTSARLPAAASPIEARLEAPSALAHSSEGIKQSEVAAPADAPPLAAASARSGTAARRSEGRASSTAAAVLQDRSAQDAPRVIPSIADPVYYPARELDVYPAPVTPLRFDYPPQLLAARIAGHVVVNLMVDEAGSVDQVAVLSAEPAGHFEEHTRAALASARFAPGRREGRAVKSRVTVRVNYDPAAREGTLR